MAVDALDPLHDEVDPIAPEPRLVDRNHVRVLELRERLGLGQEGLSSLGPRAHPQLDRHIALELPITGLDDQAHAPAHARDRFEATDHAWLDVLDADVSQNFDIGDLVFELLEIGVQTHARR